MNLLSVISDETEYTFHSHTQFCDGHATMEEMARAAVATGIRLYGFSPHSPIPFASPCNMKAEDVAAYLAEVTRIRNLFENSGCLFFSGMEIDYIDPSWGPANDYFRTLPLDYRIGSVHFIPDKHGEPVDIDGRFDSFRRKMSDHFNGDIDYVVDTFYAQSRAMLEAGGFDILGHFDKVGQNASYFAPGIEDGEHYRSCVQSLTDMIKVRKTIVELNTKARKEHGRFFPGERYLPELIKAGVPLIVNSDAHRPECINASRHEALSLIRHLQNEYNNPRTALAGT